jgi:hypothetical protein
MLMLLIYWRSFSHATAEAITLSAPYIYYVTVNNILARGIHVKAARLDFPKRHPIRLSITPHSISIYAHRAQINFPTCAGFVSSGDEHLESGHPE